MDVINLAGIVRESITDGPGIRFTVFCQGCKHGCKECHNPETWPVGKGKDVELTRILEEIKKDKLLSGVTFSGGEPFLQAKAFNKLADMIKEETDLNLMAFTGYTIEELSALEDEDVNSLLSKLDYLVDGRFEIEKRDLTLKFRGSSNQRIIDMKETIKKQKLILAMEYMV